MIQGIVPLVCEDIFKKAGTITDKTIEAYKSRIPLRYFLELKSKMI